MHVLNMFCLFFFSVRGYSYEGYKVYHLEVENERQVNLLNELRDDSNFDFWSFMEISNRPVAVMVTPKAQASFINLLNTNTIKYKVIVHNVETILEQQKRMEIQTASSRINRISFTEYHRFNEINAYLDLLKVGYPHLVVVNTIGRSYEERYLNVIQISSNRNAQRPIIFIDAGIHAREWIGPAMALYIINQLVENPTNKHLLDKVDWHILPVLNPDGYEFTHYGYRFWRKTRSFQGACIGTDANRNFDFYWGGNGTSSNPCSDIYRGPFAFSEIEARNIKNYLEEWKHRVKLYLTLHSYGNYILYPWGYSTVAPVDEVSLKNVAEKFSEAIVKAGGSAYKIGSSATVLYPAAGGSDDWAKGVAGIQFSYTIELPGGGFSGFDPEPQNVSRIVETTFHGIKTFGDYIANNFV